MTFQVRHPMVENQYCSFNINSTAANAAAVPAGRLVYIVGETADGRANVDLITNAASQSVIGFLMQKVKLESTELPPGFRFRSDMGSTDAFVGDPVGVAMGHGAVYETDQYHDVAADGITAGTKLYCNNSGKLADTNEDSATGSIAVALNSLTAAEATAGKLLRIKALI